MEAGPSLRCCGDKRNPETPTPIAKQISQAGGFVVLFGAQLRIGDEIHRDQKEAISLLTASGAIGTMAGLRIW